VEITAVDADGGETAKLVVDIVSHRIPATFGLDPVRDIQVLAPMHKGVTGVSNLNVQLQQALAPFKRKGLKTDFVPRWQDRNRTAAPALKAAGATQKILADPALEILFRASHGVLRVAGKLLRAALRIAHARGQAFLDEATLQAALDETGTT